MKTKTRRATVLALAATMLLTLFSVFTSQANAANTYEEKLQKYAYGDSKFAVYYPTDFSKSYAPTGDDYYYAEKFYRDYYLTQTGAKNSVQAFSDGYIRGIFKSGVADDFQAYNGSVSSPTKYNGMVRENMRTLGDSIGIRFQDLGMEFKAKYDGKTCTFRIKYGTMDDVIAGTASGYKYTYFSPQSRTDASSLLDSYTLVTLKYETLLRKMVIAMNAAYGTNYTVDSVKKDGKKIQLVMNSLLTIVDASSGTEDLFSLTYPEIIGDITESKNDASVTITRNISAANRTANGRARVWEATANNVPVIANSYGSYSEYAGKTLTADYQYIYSGIASILNKIYDSKSWGTNTSKEFETTGMYFNIQTTLTQPPSVYYVSGSNKTALETGMRIPTTGVQTHRNASFEAVVGEGTTLDAVKVTCLTNNKAWTSTSETLNITDLPAGEHKYKVEATSHVTDNAGLTYKTEYIITISVAPDFYVVNVMTTQGGGTKDSNGNSSYKDDYSANIGIVSDKGVSEIRYRKSENGLKGRAGQWSEDVVADIEPTQGSSKVVRFKIPVDPDLYYMFDVENSLGETKTFGPWTPLQLTPSTSTGGEYRTQIDGSSVVSMSRCDSMGAISIGKYVSEKNSFYTWKWQYYDKSARSYVDLTSAVLGSGSTGMSGTLPAGVAPTPDNTKLTIKNAASTLDGKQLKLIVKANLVNPSGRNFAQNSVRNERIPITYNGSTFYKNVTLEFYSILNFKLGSQDVGATMPGGSTSVTADINETLSTNGVPVPTRTGYTFAGWSVSATDSSALLYKYDAGTGKFTSSTSVSALVDGKKSNFVTNGKWVREAGTVDLYAVWAANTDTTYTVRHFTQDLNAAKTGVANTYSLHSTENKTGTSGTVLTLANLKKGITGFTYKEGKVGGTVVATTTIAVDGSRVIDLYYTRNTGYKLTLTAGTGIDSVSGAGSYPYGATVPINAAVKAGYTWSKWTGAAQLTAKNTAVTVTANASYAANATANRYTVTFNPNGGTVSPTTKSVTFNATYGELPTPTRVGYTFAGWYTAKTGGAKVTATTVVKTAANHTLYAHWVARSDIAYTVRHFTQDLNAAKTGVANTYSLHSTDKRTGTSDAVLTLSNLKKDIAGFTYKEGKVGGNVVTKTTIAPDGSRVIDLYYSRNVNCRIDLVAGTGISATTGGGTYPYGATVTIDATVRSGYSWYRWTVTSTGSLAYNNKSWTLASIQGNVSYTANATANKYTVTFDPNGGKVSPTSKSVTFASVYGELPTPTRPGYDFKGWYTAKTSGYQVSENTMVAIAGNHTLYARWTARNDTPYVVNHYTQDLNAAKTGVADTYSLHSTDKRTGTSDAVLTLSNLKKDIAGFTYKEGKVGGNVVTKTTIAPDGSRVIDLYYSRNVNCRIDLVAGTGISATTGSGTYPYGATVSIDATVKAGYTWSRWTITATGAQAFTEKTRILSNIQGSTSYTANATPSKYIVTFNPNGGTVDPETKTVTFDAPYGELPTPVRNNFIFEGWYTERRGGTRVDASTVVTTAGNHTLYAQWTPASDMLINDFGDITGVTFGLTKYMSLGGAVYDYKDDCTVDGEPQKGLAITFTTMPMKGHYVKAWIRLLGDTYNCTWSDGQTVTTVEGDGRVVIPGKLRGVHRNVTMELIVESYTDANCTQLAARETRNCLVNTDTVAPDIAFEYNRYSKKAAISVTDQIVGVKSASYDLMFKDGGGVYDQAINNSVTITIDKAGKVVITATDLLDNQVSKSFDASPAPDEEERPGTDVDPDDEPDPHDPSKYPAGTKYWKTRHFYCYLINGNS